MKEIVDNIRNVSDRLDQMIDDLNKDRKMTDNLRSTIDSLAQGVGQCQGDHPRGQGDHHREGHPGQDQDRSRRRAQDRPGGRQGLLNIKQTRIDFKYLLRYHKENDTFFSDIMVDLYPNENSFYRVGVEDIGGDPLFNLMLARDAQQRMIKRAGVISSKIGLGIDYQWAEDISYSLDFIDTRDPTVRFTSAYAIRPGLKFQLRVDDVTKKKDVNFAIEYKF